MVEAKVIVEHEAWIAVRFLEDKIICIFRVPNYNLINNSNEWAAKFDQLCKNYGITHQYITPPWPRCNDMAKKVVKTLKHGLTVLFATFERAQDWDEHLPRILFGCRCGVHVSIRFPLHMVLIGCISRLQVDNFLGPLARTYDVDEDPTNLAKWMIEKM